MKKISIEIICENASFEGTGEYEVSRILKRLSEEIRQGVRPESLRDYNGNTVGYVKYK